MKKNNINIPELALIVLVGTSSSGKSTFAKKHFKATEIISSDYCRALVSDDENNMKATNDAFDLVHFMIEKRLKRGRLTVVDATNLRPESRKSLLRIAKKYHVLPIAIILNIPQRICIKRNKTRTDRVLPKHVLHNQMNLLRQSFGRLGKEGFKSVYEFRSPEEVKAVEIIRRPLFNNKKNEQGPFDIIGDVHGCFKELRLLLEKLDYKIIKHRDRSHNWGYTVRAPKGRKVLFVGDLVDRGPASNEVLRLAMSMIEAGQAYCVRGNHDDKLRRKLKGNDVKLQHGLAETMEQLKDEQEDFLAALPRFLHRLTSHYVLDDGKLVIVHAGLKEEMQGRTSQTVLSYAMYGETTGILDENNLPERIDWAKDYNGKALVVYGHTPIQFPEFDHNTINIDTGCVFGATLTALRYPERELVQVDALKTYSKPSRPIRERMRETINLPIDDVLNIQDVQGRQVLQTELVKNITIREENAIPALENMSRFTIHPRWLMYLPPTMSPSATSNLEGYLEHPIEAIDYYKTNGVKQIICEEKHMGSRAIIVIAKDDASIQEKFGLENKGIGKIYTRTGRSFFKEDEQWEALLLDRFRIALDKANFWETNETNWAIFDCELMPWSAKAQALLQEQYAAVACAAVQSRSVTQSLLEQAQERVAIPTEIMNRFTQKKEKAHQFKKAYHPYCWKVERLEDFKIAPFHLLATEGNVHTNQNHKWHMETIHDICKHDPEILLATAYKIINLEQETEIQNVISWWTEMTEKGGEGMVVKPLAFIVHGAKGILQPAIKCRGKEYLRLIYGPDYDLPKNLKKLRKRGLGKKRAMASREFALGQEALQAFVKGEGLRRVHQLVFGIMALESEPIDPRL